MTEREDLFSFFSDGYKDMHGVRPHHVTLASLTTEELRARVDEVYADLALQLDREREEAEAEAQWWAEADLSREEAEATPEEFPLSGEGWSYSPAEE